MTAPVPSPECVELQQRGGFWEDILANRCSFPIAPMNTWSNLAYLAAGIGVWLYSGAPAKVEAILLGLLAVGSALFHGFKTRFTDELDNAGMYLVYGGLAVAAVAPFATWTPEVMAAVAMLLAWRMAFLPQVDQVENTLMGAFVGLTTLAVGLHGRPLLAVVSLALFGLAFAFSWMDRKRTFWLPRFGHASWHVLTAAATYLLCRGLFLPNT